MNMQNLMAQAQKMQKDITQKKEKINQTEFVAENEFVIVTMLGSKKIKNIKIKPTSIEEDDVEVLEDMLTMAINNVNDQIDKATEKELGAYGSSLGGLL